MLITVDIGNTLIKMGLFEGSRLVKHETFTPQAVEKALDIYSDWSNYSTRSIGIASGAIDAKWPKSINWLTIDSPWPIKISYKTPESVGLDRLLFASAHWLEHRQDLITVVAGSCITYNIVN